jgi:lysine-specific demethylase 8
MERADASAPCYLAYIRTADLVDTADCDFAGLLGSEGGDDGDTRVWIGSAGTRSLLHSDLKSNLFCQIWGRKTVTLLPWRDSAAAYPFPDNLVNSQIDVAHPDLARFPRLRGATFFSSTIEPGDIVYIPRGCWHDIRSRTPSVSVNHWFGHAQSTRQYLLLLGRLGPKYWLRTASDFVNHGVLGRPAETRFFFSPASTGKRLYDAIRFRNFSNDNDPAA